MEGGYRGRRAYAETARTRAGTSSLIPKHALRCLISDFVQRRGCWEAFALPCKLIHYQKPYTQPNRTPLILAVSALASRPPRQHTRGRVCCLLSTVVIVLLPNSIAPSLFFCMVSDLQVRQLCCSCARVIAAANPVVACSEAPVIASSQE